MMMFILKQIDTLFSNIDLRNYNTKTEIDDLDNKLQTLSLSTYNKNEIATCFEQISISLNTLTLNWVLKQIV